MSCNKDCLLIIFCSFVIAFVHILVAVGSTFLFSENGMDLVGCKRQWRLRVVIVPSLLDEVQES